MSIERLGQLREKHPKIALELDLVSGRASAETGLTHPQHKEDGVQNFIESCVLEVYDLIYEQGHSGFSHGYMMSMLIPILKDLPVTPLTGAEWEWRKINDRCYQNKRCSQVFKDSENGHAYNIHGYAFSDNGGRTYYTSGDSRKEVTFPCSYKDLETQYIIKEGTDT
jgi:hypothetical protein